MNIKNAFNYHITSNTAGKALLRHQRNQYEKKIDGMHAKGDPYQNPPLKITARMSELLSTQYLKGRFTEGVKKVAWHSSGAPIEVLQALDFFLYTPDNHGALCGARKLGVKYCEVAENAGYSRDLCSYVRTDIGSFLLGETPVGKLPKPDLIVVCNNICQTILNWYQAIGVYYNVPVFIIDTPFIYDTPKDHDVEYVKNQIEELITFAERIAGKSLSYKRLTQVCRAGADCSMLWVEILRRATQRPAPITGFDAFILMGPVVALRGEPETMTFYQEVLKEVDYRVANGIGAVKNEKHRVLWDNLPIWYNMSWLAKTFASMGICVAVSNYTYSWGETAHFFDENHLLESIGKIYLNALLNQSSGFKLQNMKTMAKDFHLDGVMMHSDRSCKPYSLGQIDQSREVLKDLGIPSLIIESDHNDSRIFSEEQFLTRLQAFAEMMD